MLGWDEKQTVVLTVGDEPLLLDLCSRQLQDVGFAVLDARTGDEAVLLTAENARIDVLFTDIRLPSSMDNSSLAEMSHATYPASSVIYATGYSPEEPRQVRGSLFFRKPYAMDEIIGGIRGLVVRSCRLMG